GIERRASALGRCEGDLGASILEHVVRRGQLLQPEARLTAGVAELVVGGQNHQDFHNALLCLVARGRQAWLCWPLGGRALDLVRRRVAVIVAAGSPGVALAAKKATAAVPIVFDANDGPSSQASPAVLPLTWPNFIFCKGPSWFFSC